MKIFKNPSIFAAFLILPLMLTACSGGSEYSDQQAPTSNTSLATSAPDPFGDYWYQGEAELTSYELQQARYGSIHDGEAVMIFVTEDFSRSKQVKLDNPSSAGDDKVGVLKLNMTKKFNTGIYPYSMMSSVFTPIYRANHPRTLKVTTTSQEWCGHTFTQFNLREGAYDVKFFSYFESEGDQSLELDDVMLEDEIWTMIRLAPEALPVGDIEIIPGTMYERLSHSGYRVETAAAELNEAESNASLMEYTLSYPSRTLTIRYSKEFPHEIEGWEERYTSGRGENAKEMTTTATRKERIKLDYWNHNQPEDEVLRRELGL